MRRLVVSAVVVVLLAPGAVAATLDVQAAQNVAAATALQRIAGTDRYDTAALLSAKTFSPGIPVVYVASGADCPDPLVAAPSAARAGGPVLLTQRDVIPSATITELERLSPQRIVVVGGAATVSDAVLRALDGYDTGGGVTRVSGADRYATAAAISRAIMPRGVATVYVAAGTALADALSAGAAAAARKVPLLLVTSTSIPSSTATELRRLQPGRIIVVGGTPTVSAAVVGSLAGYTSGGVTRLAGPDRYATAVAVSKATWPTGASTVLMANGQTFADAMAAGAVAGNRNAPLLLTARTQVPWAVWQEFKRLNASSGIILGGTAVIPTARTATLRRACHASVKVAAGTKQVLRTIPNAPGQVALTFDMGGRLDPAMDILRFLAANDVCATIFPTGAMSQTAAGQQILAYVRDNRDLFEIGNHTMHHCDLVKGGGGSPTAAPCAGVTPTSSFIRSELLDAAAILKAGTGQAPAPYWRPPYGTYNSAVLDAAAAAGYTKTFMWSIDTVDWKPVAEGGPTAAQISDKVVANTVSGSIVLMHIGGYNTYEALKTMVPRLRERGYTPTSLSHMLR